MEQYKVILIAALLVTVWCKYKGSTPFPYFLVFMVMAALTELVIADLYDKLYRTNLPVLNLYSKFCTYYYLFIFYQFFKERRWAKHLGIIIIGFIVITLTWHFVLQDQKRIDFLSYTLGFLILIPLMIRYLYEVIYIRPYYNLLTDPYIYLIFGLLIFYTSSFPILSFMNILITDNPNRGIFIKLLNYGNIFLSLAYLGAALCSKYQTQSNPSSLHPS